MPMKFLTLVSIVIFSLLARFAGAAAEWQRMESQALQHIVAGK